MNVFVIPLENNRFDITLDGVKLVSSIPAVHVTQMIPALKLILKAQGYKLTKEDSYPQGGRYLTFCRGDHETGIQEKRPNGVPESNRVPTEPALSKSGVH